MRVPADSMLKAVVTMLASMSCAVPLLTVMLSPN